MRYSITRFTAVVAVIFTMLTSCITEAEDLDFDELEQQVLSEWMAAYYPEAQYWEVTNDDDDDGDNYESCYYTIVTDEGDLDEPTVASYADCWVQYNITGYTLDGGVCVTRNEIIAYQQGVYDEVVRYSPLYQDLHYNDEDYGDSYAYDYLPECLKKAFSNEELGLRKGSKVTMYIASEIIDGADSGGSGFQCEAVLGYYQPLKAVVEIVDVIENPSANEIADVNTFMSKNGGFLINYRQADSDEEIDDDDYEEYNKAQELIPEAWSNALDTVANVYINRRYTIEDSFTYINPYTSNIPGSIYNKYSMSQIDSIILVAIQEEIDDDDFYDIEYLSDLKSKDFIEFSGGANLWYIGRFLDGFIFDTNINSVMDFILDEEDYSAYSSLEYSSVSTAENSQYISAWFYSIPQLRYGQWATIITTSTHAYGEISGSTTIPAYTPLIFHIFVEPNDY
ncbi:MAG: hypothetical protein SNG27_03925 [Rikenellaceae bacterium]